MSQLITRRVDGILHVHYLYVRCKGCGGDNTITQSIAPEDNVAEKIEYLKINLRANGWVYDKEEDLWMCPDCVERTLNLSGS